VEVTIMDAKKVKKLARRIVRAARVGQQDRLSLREIVAADRLNYPELIGEIMKLAKKAPKLQLVA
jgi:hypothetical protein